MKSNVVSMKNIGAVLRYALSFRVSHPKRSAESIERRLGMRAKISYESGQPRVAPYGQPLGGFWKRSYCCFPLRARRGERPEELLLRHVRAFEKHRRYFAELARTGGRIDYYLSCESSGAVGIDVSPLLSKALGRMSIHLGVDGFESFPGSELLR